MFAALLLSACSATPDRETAPEPDGIWTGPMGGPVPATIEGGTVIGTAALAELIAERDPALVDVGPQPHKPDSIAAEAWVPRVMTRRPGGESTFVTIVEPCSGEKPLIAKSTRMPMASDSSVALVLELTDGRSDVLVSNDTGGAVTIESLGLATDAKLVLVRRDAQQRPTMISMCGGKTLQVGKVKVEQATGKDFGQFRVGQDGTAMPVAKP